MKIFIAGSRQVGRLNGEIKSKLDGIMADNHTVLLGDANGADKSVQRYLFETGYEHVIVYAMSGNVRNNIGDWPLKCLESTTNKKDFNYFSVKDKKMAEEADYGFMIWDSKSPGTLNNIINLLSWNKTALVYLVIKDEYITISSFIDLKNLLKDCSREALLLFERKFKISELMDRHIEQPTINFK